jgi:5-methylcytosine-specific restriction protein A
VPTRPPIHRPAERPRHHDERRGTAAQRGYGARWQKYRRWFLCQPQNAICVRCKAEGKATPPTVVDHITPHRGNEQLFWDPANHQPLCEGCHNHKTATEDGGFGR